MSSSTDTRRATLIGGVAILLWATLAAFTALARPLPPFQILTLSFAVAFMATLGVWGVQGRLAWARFRWPGRVWALGVGGLFGYHALYFAALGLAPPAEASLVNYLWPLLIVLGSTLVAKARLRWFHVAGAIMGLSGTALLIGPSGFSGEYAAGYACALLAAFFWAGYSILSARVADVPSDAVGGFIGATALLALFCHLGFETWVDPSPLAIVALVALGLGPVGLAFFVWDHGMKHGDVTVLGALSYATPMASTLLLVLVGATPFSLNLGIAAVLIVGGAVLAARSLVSRA